MSESQHSPKPSPSPLARSPIKVLRPLYMQLKTSLLNHDSVGMIEESLPGCVIAGLRLWFIDDRDGVHGGTAFQLRAPIFATFLDECLERIDAAEDRYRDQNWFMFAAGLWMGSELRGLCPDPENPSLEHVLDRVCDLHDGQLPPPETMSAVIAQSRLIRDRILELRPGIERIVRAGFEQVVFRGVPRREIPACLRFLFVLGLVGTGLRHPFGDEEYLKGLNLRFGRGLDGEVRNQ